MLNASLTLVRSTASRSSSARWRSRGGPSGRRPSAPTTIGPIWPGGNERSWAGPCGGSSGSGLSKRHYGPAPVSAGLAASAADRAAACIDRLVAQLFLDAQQLVVL